MKTKSDKFLKRGIPALALGLMLFSTSANALTVGAQLQNVTIADANDKPAQIPAFGKKVLAIFYTDPDVSDQNDPFADTLHEAHLPADRYQGIGIANLADAPWTPNFVIRAIIRRKIEKYNSVILTDPSKGLQKAWNLGACDNKSVVIVVGKDGKVAYTKSGPMTDAERKSTFALVQQLINQ